MMYGRAFCVQYNSVMSVILCIVILVTTCCYHDNGHFLSSSYYLSDEFLCSKY